MLIEVVSFGYKHRFTPHECNFQFDVRKASNPWKFENLRKKDGRDSDVKQFVLGNDVGRTMLRSIMDVLTESIPGVKGHPSIAGQTIRIAFACHGGHHRSVAFAEEVAHRLTILLGAQYEVVVSHLDLK